MANLPGPILPLPVTTNSGEPTRPVVLADCICIPSTAPGDLMPIKPYELISAFILALRASRDPQLYAEKVAQKCFQSKLITPTR